MKKRILLMAISLLLVIGNVFSQAKKSWDAGWAEAARRLVAHPGDSNFKIDPAIVGDWKGVESVLAKCGMKLRYLTLNQNGTGEITVLPMYVATNKKWNIARNEAVEFKFNWGVWIGQQANKPYAMIKILFQHDGSHVWMFYAKPHNESLSMVFFNERTQKADFSSPVNYHVASIFDNAWNTGLGVKLANMMYNDYQKYRQINQRRINNHMANNYIFRNTMASAGSWAGGVQLPRY